MPARFYRMAAVETDYKASEKNPQNFYILIVLQPDTVAHQEFAKRKVFHYFSVGHSDPNVKDRADRDWAHYCRCAGLDPSTVSDTDMILGRAVDVKISIEAASGGYGPKNRASKFFTAGEKTGAAQHAPPAHPPGAQPAAPQPNAAPFQPPAQQPGAAPTAAPWPPQSQ